MQKKIEILFLDRCVTASGNGDNRAVLQNKAV